MARGWAGRHAGDSSPRAGGGRGPKEGDGASGRLDPGKSDPHSIVRADPRQPRRLIRAMVPQAVLQAEHLAQWDEPTPELQPPPPPAARREKKGSEKKGKHRRGSAEAAMTWHYIDPEVAARAHHIILTVTQP